MASHAIIPYRKFGRNYQLDIVDGTNVFSDPFLTIQLPFTLEFEIVRNNLGSSNTAKIRIYNLAARTRSLIFLDPQPIVAKIKPVRLKAGYGDNLPVIFEGSMRSAVSYRQGVDFITEIECYDVGDAFIGAVLDPPATYPAGTPTKSVIQDMISRLDAFGVKPGAVGNYPGTALRGNSYVGNPIDVLKTATAGGFFIDNGVAYCLHEDECLDAPLRTINAATGLLGSPKRYSQFWTFDILFEPRIVVGQKITVESSTSDVTFNGDYVVVGFTHKGTISEVVCGTAITTVEVLANSNLTTVGTAVPG